MLARLPYVFTLNSVSLRTQIAEIVCRPDRGNPKAFQPLLARTLPLCPRPKTTAQEVNS
jgi:hypothetical protein